MSKMTVEQELFKTLSSVEADAFGEDGADDDVLDKVARYRGLIRDEMRKGNDKTPSVAVGVSTNGSRPTQAPQKKMGVKGVFDGLGGEVDEILGAGTGGGENGDIS